MKALVGIKRVIDYAVKARVKADKSGIDKTNVKMSINPFCEIAVEEAIRMKEKGWVSNITTLSIGDKGASETLRHTLALGADDSIHVSTGEPIDTAIQPLAVAKVLKHFIQKENYNIILLGKQVIYITHQAIDDDSNQTAQILSALLNWPVANFASSINKLEDNKFEVIKEIDTGLQKVHIDTPCIISCDLRLNTPRYTSLKNITAAKKKTIKEFKLEELGIDYKPKVSVLEITEPVARKGGVKVKDVDELIDKLLNEAKII